MGISDVFRNQTISVIHEDELNKLGFDTVTIEGGYSAYKDYENKK